MMSWTKVALAAAAALAAVEHASAFAPIGAPALRVSATPAICAPALRSRVALKAADPETDALEECLLVMKPCDPEDSTNDDECLDEEALVACTELSEQALRAEQYKMQDKDGANVGSLDGSF
jgi:hypothetical protein